MRVLVMKRLWPIAALIASILAVPGGYYLWTAYSSSSSQPLRGPQMASVAIKGDAPPSSMEQRELAHETTQAAIVPS